MRLKGGQCWYLATAPVHDPRLGHGKPLPVHVEIVGDADVGEEGVLGARVHRIGVAGERGSGSDAEDTKLGVDGMQSPVAAGTHPCNVVAHSFNLCCQRHPNGGGTFQPGSEGSIMARLVFPLALGNAAAMYRFSPFGFVIPKIWPISK